MDRPEPIAAGLEIGLVTPDAASANDSIRAFSQAVETAIRDSLDGRRTRHMTFDWRHLESDRSRLDQILNTDEQGTGPVYQSAQLNREEVSAAHVLASEGTRRLLRDVARQQFVKKADLRARSTDAPEALDDHLEQLIKAALVRTGWLVECKSTSRPLTRIEDAAQIMSPPIGSLVCPMCSSAFSEENLAEGYVISDSGYRLSQKNFWLTVWITQQMVEFGVPLESIVWNVVDSGDEVDIIAEFLGALWILELKDREFGFGDAHAFNYRRGRYRADRAIIVTTDKVSPDAKRVFDEVSKQQERAGAPQLQAPVYIEGLASAHAILAGEISKAARAAALRRFRILDQMTDLRLLRTVSARLSSIDG